MDLTLLSAIALVAVIVSPVIIGYVVGKVKRRNGDDVEVDSLGGAMAAAQGKRMDLKERRGSDDGDNT